MFVNVVTIEKDAETVANKEDYAIYTARVSFRTKEGFQSIEKDGSTGRTYTQFVDSTFYVRKSKEGKEPFTQKDLTIGTMLFVEGEIGQDVVPKRDNPKERMYFVKLRINNARLIGQRPVRGEPKTELAAAVAAPAAKAEKLEPRKPKDEGDEYDAFLS